MNVVSKIFTAGYMGTSLQAHKASDDKPSGPQTQQIMSLTCLLFLVGQLPPPV
jgi:hypothetical protein